MKVAFVGSCQVHSMAGVAQHLLPDAEIVSFHLNAPLPWNEIEKRIEDCDYAVTQFPDEKRADGSELPLSVAALRQTMRDAAFQPSVTFTGFHPDSFYLLDNNSPINGPYAHYHSQIALGGYLAGLDVDRTVALFNAHIFSELGYFDAYDLAEQRMLRTFRRADYRLGKVMRQFRATRTVFMHTLNHPTIALVGRLTVLALARLRLVDDAAPIAEDIADPLAQSLILPVLPPLARRLDMDGSETIFRPIPQVGVSGDRTASLQDQIACSFDIYRATDPAKLRGSNADAAVENIARLLA